MKLIKKLVNLSFKPSFSFYEYATAFIPLLLWAHHKWPPNIIFTIIYIIIIVAVRVLFEEQLKELQDLS